MIRFRIFLCVALLGPGILVGQNVPAAAGPATKSSDTESLRFIRFTPVAVFSDGDDRMTVEVSVEGPASDVTLVDQRGLLRVDGEPTGPSGKIPLSDAGGGRWVRDGITSTTPDQAGSVEVIIQDDDGARETHFRNNLFFTVDPAHGVPVRETGATIRTAGHLVNLRDDSGDLVSVGPSTGETQLDHRATAREFYRHFPDDYDYLSIFTGVTFQPGAFHSQVHNDVEGIGVDTFDFTDDFRSNDGRLRGVNVLRLSSGGPLLHETTHSVAAFLDKSLGLDDGTPHWGAVDIPGFVFGLDFEEQDDGQYLVTWTRFGGLDFTDSLNRQFPPMELYLWGLAPPESVPPVTVLEGIDARAARAGDVVEPDGVRSVTIEDITTVHGPRSPDFTAAPRNLRMAGVLVTPKRQASDAEMALWNRVMRHFGSAEATTLLSLGSLGSSFYYATDGRSQIDTTIDPPASNAHLRRRVTGNYFNPDRDGEGCQLTLESDDEIFILTCYTYLAGNQVWMIGTATLEGNVLESTDMIITRGTGFGDAFDTGQVERIPWGTVTMDFADCNNAQVRFDTVRPEFESFSVPMQKIQAGPCDRGVPDPEKSSLVGNYFDPERDGEGFQLSLEADGETFVLTFYTYLGGEQAWLLGTGTLEDNRIVFADTIITEGADFGSAFDHRDIERIPWGEIIMEINDCNNGVLRLDPDLAEFQELEVNVTRIVPGACPET